MKSEVSTPLWRYGVAITALATYALLPTQGALLIYFICRLLALSLIVHLVFPQLESFFKPYHAKLLEKPLNTFQYIINNALDLLFAFQSLLAKLKRFTEKENRKPILIGIVLLFMLLPNQLVFLTQYLAVYTLSLFSYQFATIYYRSDSSWLKSKDSFTPSEDQKKLTELQIVQMKLVTMFLINIVTFIPMPYYAVVSLFIIVPILIPLCADRLRALFNSFYSSLVDSLPEKSLSKKAVDGFLIVSMLFSLLINYKYETHILNFLLAMYSSILIGQISKAFYSGHDDSRVTSGDQIIDTLYNSEIVLAFWAVCLIYEITTLINIPRLLFIAFSLTIGVDLDVPFNFAMAFYTRSYNATTAFKSAATRASQLVVELPYQFSCTLGFANHHKGVVEKTL